MSEDEEELCEEEPSHTCDPHQNGIDKFIVCQEVLMSLFALCPACCEKSDSLCIMWLPTFLAKPANAPQEHGVSRMLIQSQEMKLTTCQLRQAPYLLLQKDPATFQDPKRTFLFSLISQNSPKLIMGHVRGLLTATGIKATLGLSIQ
ncbi:hypothetical protein N1851_003765 [Merluccius polli]|uniref:Uncharacterized protein n=1 Tax=Merluccius polli TaxID=89951 RepID=A0AA47P7U2_MERPO|nr:hypothetical protein N1851_003765 [Merluccius polli]